MSRDTAIPKPTTPHEYTYINEEGVLQSVRDTYESKDAGNEQGEERLELPKSQPPRKIASLSDKLLQGQKVSSTKTFTKKEYADEPLDISDTQERELIERIEFLELEDKRMEERKFKILKAREEMELKEKMKTLEEKDRKIKEQMKRRERSVL